ncbi:MAG: DUF3592 domain-containing protein [Amylibacter sp.]
MTDLLFVWMPVIAALLIAAFGVLLLFLGSKTYVQAVWLRRGGVAGNATITRHYEKKVYVNPKERHGTTVRYTQHVDYEIHHDGQTYVVKDRRPSNTLWESLSVGDNVDVIYLPRNPKNSQLAEAYKHAGAIGGIVQMIAGTVMVTGGAVFVLSGLWAAAMPPDQRLAADDWVRDQAIVFSIRKSDDAFIRMMRPNTRQVRLVVGDDDGGREITGQADFSLGPNEYPELRVGDVLSVWRAPDNKDKAVLHK